MFVRGKYLLSLFVVPFVLGANESPTLFDVDDTAQGSREGVPVVQPWKEIRLDAAYGGLWVVAGDLDGDGAPELLSAENVNVEDVHYTSAVAAQRLDGSLLWHWGDADAGRKEWHHDVACQIHDWNGDGKNEVVLATRGALVELDGATGAERRRIPIPEQATDCVVFCDLSGAGRPSDVLVKDRYRHIWAYNFAGALLWDVADPGGYRTAHQPWPVDIDRDGRDEVFAGFALLNADASVRWLCQAKSDIGRGHLDCARALRLAEKTEDVRLVLTCCGANTLLCVDGGGKEIWSAGGNHFESIDVGRVVPEVAGPQAVVDIDHQPYGQCYVWVLGEDGAVLGKIKANYARHHALVDWSGDGLDEIVIAHGGGVFDGRGRCIATLALPVPREGMLSETSVLVGDMSGDAVPDVMLATPSVVYLYRNEKGRPLSPAPPCGTGLNFTLY